MPIIRSEDQLFDIRLVKRHIEKGRTTEKEYDRFMKDLEDVGENLDYITRDMIFDELDDEDLDEDEDEDEEEDEEDLEDDQ